MANERLFIVRNAAGEEFGPADQQTLVKWCEAGKIDLECKIRSTMVNQWDKAIDLPFLKSMLKEQLVARVNAQHDTPWERIKARINLRVEDIANASNGLVKHDEAAAPSANVLMRIMAFLTDLFIMFLWGVVLHLICAFCYKHEIFDGENIFYIAFPVYFLTFFLYYIFSMYLKQQTPGQHFWGIYLVRNTGEGYWMGRIFFYVVLMFPCIIVNPLFLFATRRTAQEVITKTRMARVVIDLNKIKPAV